ncbi:MAG: hypothetical protein A3J67_06625 [Parcubacteria group bacterium RIFCSPHIGHO2_02_FULL_48_10b]|nr:MAG: hypothetical protein A3J67_06625 [Parcubacteria group bacterium RIFCSPHIGHO2_02_FULL_48_10b]
MSKLLPIAFFTVLITVSLLIPADAHAWIHDEIASALGGAVLDVMSFFIGMVASILGIFVSIATIFTGAMLKINFDVLKNPVATVGWVATRDFANLGFVLVLLIIAFATILRIQSYGMKSLLWKLIIAAVLVNFSFTIAAAFIDFSHILAKTFMNRSLPQGLSGPMDYGTHLAGNLNPQAPYAVASSASALAKTASFTSLFLSVLFGFVFAILYTLILIVVISALGVLFVVRFVHLTFLLVLAPLAWLFWATPMLSHLAKQWWNSFLRWVFFAPAALFFIWLSLKISTQAGAQKWFEDTDASLIKAGVATKLDSSILTGNLLTSLANMFLLGSLLVGSVIVADKMGVDGARAAVNAATKVPRATAEFLKRRGALLKNKALQKAMESKAGKKVAGALQAIPLFGGIVTPALADLRAGAKGKEVEFYQEKYANYDQQQLEAAMRQTKNSAEAAALSGIAGKKGFLRAANTNLSRKERLQLAVVADQAGLAPDGTKHSDQIVKGDPTLAYNIARLAGKNDEDSMAEMSKFMKEKMSPEDIARMDPSAADFDPKKDIADPKNIENRLRLHVALLLDTGRLGRVISEGGPAVDSIEKTLKWARANRDEVKKEDAILKLPPDKSRERSMDRLLDYWEQSPVTAGRKLPVAAEEIKYNAAETFGNADNQRTVKMVLSLDIGRLDEIIKDPNPLVPTNFKDTLQQIKSNINLLTDQEKKRIGGHIRYWNSLNSANQIT